MEFKYLEEDDVCHPLITDFYLLEISKDDVPFESKIIPVGETSITYVFCEQPQIAEKNNKIIYYNNLTLSGQFFGSYLLRVFKESVNLGFSLHPTSLYKILNKNVAPFLNNHLPLQDVDPQLHEKLSSIFIDNKNDITGFKKAICSFLDTLPLSKNKYLPTIDNVVNYIIEKDGLVKVSDIVNTFHISQKHLETNFKKIVGLTPKRFIRQQRFVSLMKKYQTGEQKLNDLIYKFEYFDSSHFIKDCNFFLGSSPKVFFKNDYPLIEKYLID